MKNNLFCFQSFTKTKPQTVASPGFRVKGSRESGSEDSRIVAHNCYRTSTPKSLRVISPVQVGMASRYNRDRILGNLAGDSREMSGKNCSTINVQFGKCAMDGSVLHTLPSLRVREHYAQNSPSYINKGKA